MKIKDITRRRVAEDAKITNIDAAKKTVTYSDPNTNISTTVPDTMVKPQGDGSVAVDTKAVSQASSGEAPKITMGASIKDMNTSEGSGTPYFVDMVNGVPMAKTSPKPTAIVPSKLWWELTPDVEAKAAAQGFHKVTLQAGGKQIMGLEGGDAKLGSKIIVAPGDFQSLKTLTVKEGDIGGDPTDDYINDVVDHDFERAQGRLRELAGMPDLENIDAKTLDSAEGFKSALKQAATDAGVEPETAQTVDKLVVAAPDGTVDIHKTFVTIAAQFGDAMGELAKMLQDLAMSYEKGMASPEFQQFDEATKQSVKEAFAELTAMLPKIVRDAQQMSAQAKSMQSARPTQESKELDAMLRIAGLR